MLLALLCLVALTVVVEVHRSYREEHQRLLTLQLVAQKQGPPAGCSVENTPSFFGSSA